jgi:hypothetical protein
MASALCTCISYGCCNKTDYRPHTREVVQGQFLPPRVRKAHMRMDESTGAGHDVVGETIFQASCTLTADMDPVVNARAHSSPPQPHIAHPIPITPPNPVPGSSELDQYRSRFLELQTSFQPPTSLEFEHGTSPTPILKYTAASNALLQHQELITQLLVLIDGVECAGEVRQTRKDLVVKIQAHLHYLDGLVSHIWANQQYHDRLQQISGQTLIYDNRGSDFRTWLR